MARPTFAGVGSLSVVPDSGSSGTILPANGSRQSVVLHNASGAILYIRYGTPAALNAYTYKIPPRGHWEMPFRYTGVITGIWSSDDGGDAYVTELT